jgi:hypothetical protein
MTWKSTMQGWKKRERKRERDGIIDDPEVFVQGMFAIEKSDYWHHPK